jgi:lactoylglutathione lyase
MKITIATLLVGSLLTAFIIKPKQKNMEIKFAYTILYVNDVEKSIAFYEKAFGFTRKFVTPENDYGELLVGETTLSFTSTALGIEIAFTTKDVDAVVKSSIEAGATLVVEPKAKPWGQVVAYVRDYDGFLIEICTPMN